MAIIDNKIPQERTLSRLQALTVPSLFLVLLRTVLSPSLVGAASYTDAKCPDSKIDLMCHETCARIPSPLPTSKTVQPSAFFSCRQPGNRQANWSRFAGRLIALTFAISTCSARSYRSCLLLCGGTKKSLVSACNLNPWPGRVP